MTNVNPNNYDGARAFVVGRAGGEPKERNGFTELSVAVSQGYKKDGEWVDIGTAWYTFSASSDYADQNWPEVGKGDKVRIDDAKLEVREYTKNDGSTGRDNRLTYGTLTVLESKQDTPF